jgi:hypothetical protein
MRFLKFYLYLLFKKIKVQIFLYCPAMNYFMDLPGYATP